MGLYNWRTCQLEKKDEKGRPESKYTDTSQNKHGDSYKKQTSPVTLNRQAVKEDTTSRKINLDLLLRRVQTKDLDWEGWRNGICMGSEFREEKSKRKEEKGQYNRLSEPCT